MTGGRVERRLAAIMAADVAGYSRLMGADEVGTLTALKTIRRETVDPAITGNKGRIVKTTGDGLLVEFASVVDAVTCAMAVQDQMAKRDNGAAISFRIGINIGDIIIDGDDIFGDGVNVAARVENECEPGGVCLSGSAFEQVRGKTGFSFDDLGEKSLKNIDRPVRLYAARLASSATTGTAKPATASATQLPLPDKPSVAVLPFENMSGDPEQEYFADGIVEDIITALSRFKSLFVIARNSSFTYKGKTVDIKQVGRELGVRYVLEGSVRKAGGKVRITGQLIDAASGAHLWADRFDGPLDDIFELQDKVTSSVVSAIAPRLERAEIERSESKPTESLAAMDLYYRAISAYWTHTRQGTEDGLRLARQSISLDPNFAGAYGAALACYSLLREEGWGDPAQLFAEGKQYALRAVDLGADDAFALARAAHFLATTVKDTETGDALIDQAIAVNPNHAGAWRIRGWISLYLGRHEQALEQLHHAMRLDPLDFRHFTTECGLAAANLFLGQFEIALSWVTKSLARHNTYAPALRVGVASYAMLGRIPDAQMLHARLRETGAPPLTISQIEKWIPYRRREDFDLFVKSYRIAGVPE